MADLTNPAALYADLTAQIDSLTELRNNVRDEMAAAGPGLHTAGALAVTVSAPRRLNADLLRAMFPAEDFPMLYKPTPDTAAVKNFLSTEVLEGLYQAGNLIVKVAAA